MRELTEQQMQALDRIAASASGRYVKVVGWTTEGPVLRTKRGKLAVLLPSTNLQEITEVASP